MTDELSPVDVALLDWLLGGGTIVGYGREHSYSRDWGKWKSREIRRKLGVSTIEEALQLMAQEDEGVSKADFEKLTGLVGKLGDAIEELAKRPADPAQQQQVRERELDVKDHAKALGVSLEDVEKIRGEKEYEKWLAFEKRRIEEEEAEEGGNGSAGGKSLGDTIRDGLGGIRNVKQ